MDTSIGSRTATALVIVGAAVTAPALLFAAGMAPTALLGGSVEPMAGVLGETITSWQLVVWQVMLVGGGVVLLAGLSLLARGRGGAVGTDPALEELREASARGELSDEEYRMRRERIERNR